MKSESITIIQSEKNREHALAEEHFRSYEEAKNCVDSWIASKDEQFFQRRIRMMPQRWERVVAILRHRFYFHDTKVNALGSDGQLTTQNMRPMK